jgi:hypothetical protein
MLRGNSELWAAAIVMVLITALYGTVVFFTRDIPPAGELFGHSIGIIGFIFMLTTETLYSLRKRSRSVKWGRMSTWLQLHIFTGLVGLMEIQRAGRRHDITDHHHCYQRNYWKIHLHPNSAHVGWA